MLVSLRNLVPIGPSVATLLLAMAFQASADTYVYTDEKGVVHFTDSPKHEGFKLHARSRPRVRSTRAWDGVIRRAADEHGVDPGLVKAVIHAESGFNVAAVSGAGARGLMQLMPKTARALGVDDPFDAWQNIDGGTRHLGYLIQRYNGDLKLALAAYNAGGRAVSRFGGIPPYEETRKYVKRVLALYDRYDADFR
jgi:soluble lytic murein transglycosylase